MKTAIDHVPSRPRQRTIFDDSVATKIEALLQRCDRIKLARDLHKPTQFNREGERHARQVAQADQSRGIAPHRHVS